MDPPPVTRFVLFVYALDLGPQSTKDEARVTTTTTGSFGARYKGMKIEPNS